MSKYTFPQETQDGELCCKRCGGNLRLLHHETRPSNIPFVTEFQPQDGFFQFWCYAGCKEVATLHFMHHRDGTAVMGWKR